jgi:hypothetical protein
MLAWGPRYFAAGVGQELQGALDHIRLVDDKVSYAPLVEAGPLITPEYTFYNQPVGWWAERLDAPVYLYAAGPGLVEITTAPVTTESDVDGVTVAEARLTCAPDSLLLDLTWQTGAVPEEDLSVFVHAVDAADQVIAQADQFAPVYGRRPLTTWLAREQVRDIYPIQPVDVAAVEEVRYGLYRVTEDGFENVAEYSVEVNCNA